MSWAIRSRAGGSVEPWLSSSKSRRGGQYHGHTGAERRGRRRPERAGEESDVLGDPDRQRLPRQAWRSTLRSQSGIIWKFRNIFGLSEKAWAPYKSGLSYEWRFLAPGLQWSRFWINSKIIFLNSKKFWRKNLDVATDVAHKCVNVQVKIIYSLSYTKMLKVWI
jgi:hypothetical protein